VGFDVTDQILIRSFAFVRYRSKNGSTMRHQLFTDFKKACDSVKREVLYNILIEFEVLIKPVKLIKIYLNETYSEVCIVKHCLVIFLSKSV
jgi:hypothetical protein